MTIETFETLEFYRGMSKKYPIDKAFLYEPRMDRRPKNSSLHFHEEADKWFFHTFGVKYRSQGTFVTSSLLVAQHYAHSPAHVMRMVPIAAYQFCWSPLVSDLLFKEKDLKTAESSEIHRCLAGCQYSAAGLADAHHRGHEVMISCVQYLAVPVGLLSKPQSKLGSGLILPFGS